MTQEPVEVVVGMSNTAIDPQTCVMLGLPVGSVWGENATEVGKACAAMCCAVLSVCVSVYSCMHACIPRKLVQVRNEYMEAKSKAMGLPSTSLQYFSATQLAAMDTNNDGMRAGHMCLLCSLLPALCTVPGKACLDSHICASAPACVRVSRLRFRGGAAGLACAERRRPGLSPNHS